MGKHSVDMAVLVSGSSNGKVPGILVKSVPCGTGNPRKDPDTSGQGGGTRRAPACYTTSGKQRTQ